MAIGQWLGLGYIKASTGNLTAVQRSDQSVGVDERTASHVHQHGIVAHLRELGCANQVFGLGGVGGGKQHHIGLAQRRLQIGRHGCAGHVTCAASHDRDSAAERLDESNELVRDATCTDDRDVHPEQRAPTLATHPMPSRQPLRNDAQQRQSEHERVLGHRLRIGTFRARPESFGMRRDYPGKRVDPSPGQLHPVNGGVLAQHPVELLRFGVFGPNEGASVWADRTELAASRLDRSHETGRRTRQQADSTERRPMRGSARRLMHRAMLWRCRAWLSAQVRLRSSVGDDRPRSAARRFAACGIRHDSRPGCAAADRAARLFAAAARAQ